MTAHAASRPSAHFEMAQPLPLRYFNSTFSIL